MIKRFLAHIILEDSVFKLKCFDINTTDVDAKYITLNTDNIVLAEDIRTAVRYYRDCDKVISDGYYRLVQMSSGQWLVLRGKKEEDLYFDFDHLDKENNN